MLQKGFVVGKASTGCVEKDYTFLFAFDLGVTVLGELEVDTLAGQTLVDLG
ncbi:hypothetical protein KC317_g16676, partial [Hortaea werneckii]